MTLIFYGENDGNIFSPIKGHQGCLERREPHPGGVQQEKHMFLLYMCDTSYNPIFL